ncbi:MAG: RluA family pseudouridine synthase [Leptospirales bacterium]|nr:RluA family pseudouridine synthase [Leptospirales bacterium]
MEREKYIITVPMEFDLERIDRVIPVLLEADISRSQIQKLIKSGDITVNGFKTRANYKVKTDDEIEIIVNEEEPVIPQEENIPINIIYEDEDIAVIIKQPGLVVHAGHGNYGTTLVSGLLYHIKRLSALGDPLRPGIVHRLDRDTSGLMVIAKSDAAYISLVEQFSLRTVEKHYIAIVIGKPVKDHDLINRPIARHKKYRQKMTIDEDGREAITEYTISRIWHTDTGAFTMLDIILHTGRTHQIRVHLSAMGNPIIGDQIYSKRWEKYRVPYLLLASTYLKFTHPTTGKELSFTAELPSHFSEYIDKLNSMVNQ